MLSIGKLAAGQAKYYLDQAEGRVDVVESVGDGIEDYYSAAALRRAGEWIGIGGAPSSGLGGAVDGDALRRVLAGGDPRTASRCGLVEPRAGRRLRSDVLGAEERERAVRARRSRTCERGVRAAHDRAVRRRSAI